MILYVEDSRLNQVLFEAYFEKVSSYQIEVADSVDTGIAAAIRRRPLIALIDLDLSGRSGTEVLRALKALPGARAIWCVALTAGDSEEQRRATRAEGFDDYWTKSMSQRATLAKIAHLVDGLHARSERSPP